MVVDALTVITVKRVSPGYSSIADCRLLRGGANRLVGVIIGSVMAFAPNSINWLSRPEPLNRSPRAFAGLLERQPASQSAAVVNVCHGIVRPPIFDSQLA